MAPTQLLQARDDAPGMSSAQSDLCIILVTVILTGSIIALGIFLFRGYQRRKAAQATLPSHLSPQHSLGHRRQMTITTTPVGGFPRSSIIDEKLALMDSSAPSSPIPQIHITFPDEVDEKSGKRQSARVVVVTINDKGGVGLEPYDEDPVPAYQPREGDGFKSLDLERIGGLKEMEVRK